MKKRIAGAMRALGIAKKDMYTAKELEQIAKAAGCSVLRVMEFLRFGR